MIREEHYVHLHCDGCGKPFGLAMGNRDDAIEAARVSGWFFASQLQLLACDDCKKIVRKLLAIGEMIRYAETSKESESPF